LGHEVIRFPYRDKTDTEMMIAATTEEPDVCLFSKCNRSNPAIVEEIKNKGITCILWYMDPVHNIDEELKRRAHRVDIVFTNILETVEHLKINNGNVHFLQEGFDPEVDKPIDSKFSEIYSASFIGSIYGDRQEWIDAVDPVIITEAYGSNHAEAVAQTKINLNFTSGGASDRVYKIWAAGGFLLTQPWPGMEADFTPGEDFDTFTSARDLKIKIDYYLRHEEERKEIASNGLVTVQKFSRDHWASEILRITDETCNADA